MSDDLDNLPLNRRLRKPFTSFAEAFEPDWRERALTAEARALTAERENKALREELRLRKSADLVGLMRDISERHYCAGWMNGLEHSLWAIVFEDAPRDYGMFPVSDEDVARLRSLAEETGTWWRWGVGGEEPVPLDTFREQRRTLLDQGPDA